MSSAQTRTYHAVTTGPLEEERRKIAAAIKTAPLDALAQSVTADMARALGASSVRLYFKDLFSDELYARWQDGQRLRELRVPADPSNVVGYAAMTRTRSFGWKHGSGGGRRYVVAVPLVAGGDLFGVLELTHATPDVTPDETRAKVFNDLAAHLARRLQMILKVTVRATPYDYLLQSGALSSETLRDARAKAKTRGQSVEHVLISELGVGKEDLGRSLSAHFQCAFTADPGAQPISHELVARFSPSFLRARAVLPVRRDGDVVHVVIVNPRNLTLLDDVARQAGAEKVMPMVAVREDILQALDRFVGPESPAAAPAPSVKVEEDPETAPEPEWEPVQFSEAGFDLSDKQGEEVDSATIRLVNETIQTALDQNASDIHIEPLASGGVVIRFRVDGALRDHQIVRQGCARAVVSRLKIMSKLDIAEHRLPQDGKIRLRDRNGTKVDLRVAIVPTQEGYEDVVLRLLPETQALKLEQIGMEADQLARFRRAVEQPHGIILTVGPTGSGKTTTLHAVLAHLKGPTVKIWTAEDPVEIAQEGIRQVQVQAKIGLTFAHAMRAFLRCDPDIIMIGEIRDHETASTAIEASLTGHLVLSTLHTNSASETVTRLLEMGLDAFTFGDSLLGVLAQRLVRRVCPSCREVRPATSEEMHELRRQYGDAKAFDALGVDRRGAQLAHPKGCDACFNSGYKGRTGIYELLVVNPEIRRMIQQRAESSKIREKSLASGMTLLKQDGIRKVLAGVTDLKEVLSTCVEENL